MTWIKVTRDSERAYGHHDVGWGDDIQRLEARKQDLRRRHES